MNDWLKDFDCKALVEKLFSFEHMAHELVLGRLHMDPPGADECRSIVADCMERALELSRDFEAQVSSRCDLVRQNAATVQYAKNGIKLHRGYYSPSPIEEYRYTPQRSRGRLTKKRPLTAPRFAYYFDDEMQLTGVECWTVKEHTFELIIRQEDIEIGLTYTEQGTLCAISFLSQVDGQVQWYGHFNAATPQMSTMMLGLFDKYTYRDGQVYSMLSMSCVTYFTTIREFSAVVDDLRIIRDEKGMGFVKNQIQMDDA